MTENKIILSEEIEELLPCPFCGAKAEIQWESNQGFVSCTNKECYATSNWIVSEDSVWIREQVTAAWNRRADVQLQELQKLIEANYELIELLKRLKVTP